MRVSVIVPAHEAAATVAECLAAVARQDVEEPYEVILVLDAEDDGTGDAALRSGADFSVVRETAPGPAAKRNRGATSARGDVLAFTDADCFPTEGWLSAGLRALERAELVQGAVRPPPGASRGPFDRYVWVDREVGLYETANLFVTREAFDKAGGFRTVWDPNAQPFGEDALFGWEARRTGARTAFCPDALVYHAVFPRGPRAYLAERLRRRFFPQLTAQVPELRETLYFARYFLNRRTAAFDAAVAGSLAAAVISAWPPLLAAAPYAAIACRDALRWRRRAVQSALVDLVADVASCAALFFGSVRHRQLLL